MCDTSEWAEALLAAADVQLTKPRGSLRVAAAYVPVMHGLRSLFNSEGCSPAMLGDQGFHRWGNHGNARHLFRKSTAGHAHTNTDTHSHTRSLRKRSTCSRGPVRCSGCNHPRLLTNSNQNNSSFNSNTNNQVKWSNTSIQPQVHCCDNSATTARDWCIFSSGFTTLIHLVLTSQTGYLGNCYSPHSWQKCQKYCHRQYSMALYSMSTL